MATITTYHRKSSQIPLKCSQQGEALKFDYSRVDKLIDNFLPDSFHKYNKCPGLNFQILSKAEARGIPQITDTFP